MSTCNYNKKERWKQTIHNSQSTIGKILNSELNIEKRKLESRLVVAINLSKAGIESIFWFSRQQIKKNG